LAAIRTDGLRLICQNGSEQDARLRATDHLAELGPQDIVILAVKAHQLGVIAAQLPSLFTADTIVVTAQNGIPWWYFYKCIGPFEGRRIELLDPGGLIAAHIDSERIIGTVPYPACILEAPGIVRVIEGNRFPVGELDGGSSSRVQHLSSLLRGAGFKSPVLDDIRSEIWLKLWGSMAFNPLSALTRATLIEICDFAPTRELAVKMMTEAQTVGERLGVRFRVPLERRIAGAAAVGHHKTSMLQDVEMGREIELDALVGAVIELGRIVGVPTPTTENIYALAALLATTLSTARSRAASN
jgi:2-dehydropantoate 2-reductase